MAYDIGPKIGIEGEAEFRKQINDINTTMKTLASEMKLVSSQFVGNEKSVEAYAKKNGVLSKEITTQKEKLILLHQGLQKSIEKYGEADSRTQKWQQAVNSATAELNRMGAELKENTAEIDKLNSASEKLKNLGENISAASGKIKDAGAGITNVGKTVSVASAAVGGIGVAAIKTAADFESSMSQVAATMGMTTEEINNGSEDYKKLEEAAREMGSATQFSATEAAEALNYLALAGYDTDKAVGTLPTILNLAAAGGIELGAASDMVTDAMSALGDKAGTAESFVDKMAKTSQKSNTSVAQLGEAILTVGGTAKVLSGGVDEMNTVLGILADNGIKGAEGGTALRNMILSLTAPTDKAASELEALGINVLDIEGNMRPLNDVFGDLNSALGNMSEGEKTQVLNSIFNKVDLKSVNALLGTSVERFDDLKSQIEGSEGAAQTMAETMNNNLNGSITSLKSALSEAAISIGQELLPIIRNIADFIKELIGRFNELSPEIKQIIVAVGAAVTALGPLIVIIGTVVSAIGTIVGAVGSAAGAIGGLAAAINPVSIAIAAIVTVIAVITASLINLYQTSETFRNTVIEAFEKVKDSLSNAFNKIKETISPLINAVLELGASFIDFYENSPIKDIIALIATFSATNAGTIISTAINLISTAFSSLVGVLTGAMSILSGVFDILSGVFTLDFNKITEGLQKLGEGIGIVFGEIIKGMVGIGENIVKGLLEGISNVASNINSWIKEHVTDPLINNIKEFFGIASPSKVMEEIGGFIMEGLLNGIIALKDKIISLFEEMKTNVLAVFTAVKDTIISAMTFIKDKIVEILKNILQVFVNKLKEIKDNVSTVFTWLKDIITNTINNVYSIWEKTWANIGSVIMNAVGAVKTAVVNIKDTVTSAFNNLISSAFDWGKNLIGGFVDGIKSMISRVKNVVSSITDTVSDFIGFHSPAKKGEGRYIVDWGQNMVSGFLEGVKSAMNEVRGTAGMLSQTMGENLYSNSNSAVASKGNVNITINVGSVRNDSDIQAINSALNKTIRDYSRALGVV